MIQPLTKASNYGSGRPVLYFLSVPDEDETGWLYHEWYTLKQLTVLPQCLVGLAGLRSRLKKNHHHNLWACMTDPIIQFNGRGGIKRRKHDIPYMITSHSDQWVATWQPGSLSHTVI